MLNLRDPDRHSRSSGMLGSEDGDGYGYELEIIEV